MRETIQDVDRETELKDNKNIFLTETDKMGISEETLI